VPKVLEDDWIGPLLADGLGKALDPAVVSWRV